MITKTNQADELAEQKAPDLVNWGPLYQTGVASIDKQHRELVSLTNELYHACHTGKTMAETVFKTCMSKLVEYVRFHFGYEQKLLEKLNYPKYREHITMHSDLVQKILEAAKEYGQGKLLVPNNFVRTLSDWVFGHIAIEDKGYSVFVKQLRAKGLFADDDSGENMASV